MNIEEFDYRKQLIEIYHFLQDLATGFYAHAFNLALQDELSGFKDVMEDGDEIPGDLNYLKALKSPAVGSIVKMIERIFMMQDSLRNLNSLGPEELTLPETEQYPENQDENLQDEMPPDIEEAAMNFAYCEMMDLFIYTWQLEDLSFDVPDEMISLYEKHYFDGDIPLTFRDINARMLLEGTNYLLEVNRTIDYYDGRG